MIRVAFAVSLIITLVVVCWYYTSDFSTSSLTFIFAVLLVTWIFPLPSKEWVMINIPEETESITGELNISALKSTIKTDTKIKDLFTNNSRLEKYLTAKIRIHDTIELMEEIKEAAIKSLLPYILILLCAFLINYSFTTDGNEEAKLIKNYSTLVYLGVAFYYIGWNIRPVFIQRKKNRLAIIN